MRSVLTDGAKAKQELEREIERRREELQRLEERLGRWEVEYARSRLREDVDFTTVSGRPVKALYTPLDVTRIKAMTGIEDVRPFGTLEEDLSVALTDFRDWRITQIRRWPLAAVLIPHHGATASLAPADPTLLPARLVANLPWVADTLSASLNDFIDELIATVPFRAYCNSI